MDLRRLRIFLAVAEEGGFTRAADRLGMSQPAVSQAVGELEASVGTPLFHRLGRTVAPTPAGEALVPTARHVQRQIEQGLAAVAEVAGLHAGHLDLCCLPTLAAAPLAPLVGAFRAAHPGVSIVLADPDDTDQLLAFVRSGRSEVGLTEAVPADDLVTVPIGAQEYLVVFPPGTAAPDPFPLRHLAALPLVAPPAGTSSRNLLDDALRRAGREATVVVEASQREALLPLIASGAGVGLLPRPLAEIAGSLGCAVAEPRPPVSRRVALVHRHAPLTPAAHQFVELARAGTGSG